MTGGRVSGGGVDWQACLRGQGVIGGHVSEAGVTGGRVSGGGVTGRCVSGSGGDWRACLRGQG